MKRQLPGSCKHPMHALFWLALFALFLDAQSIPTITQWQKPQAGWLFVLDGNQGARESHVWLIDPMAGRVAGDIVVGYRPDFAMSHDGTRLYISFDDTYAKKRVLTTVDTSTGVLVRTVPNPKNIGWHVPAPPTQMMTASLDGKFLYVLRRLSTPPDRDDYSVAVYDTSQGIFLDEQAPLGDCSGTQLLPQPLSRTLVLYCGGRKTMDFFEFTPQGRLVSKREVAINTDEVPSAVGRIRESGAVSTAVLNASPLSVFLARRDGRMAKYNFASQQVSEITGTGSLPGWIPFQSGRISPDGSRIYLTAQSVGTSSFQNEYIYVFDTTSSQLIGNLKPSLRVAGIGLSPDGQQLYASFEGGVFVIDTKTMAEVRAINFGKAPSLIIVAR